jgi:hypothetical protein
MNVALPTTIGISQREDSVCRCVFDCLRRVSRVSALALVGTGAMAQVNVLTFHNDIARTGQNLNETILTPANVNPTQFGKLFSQPVTGRGVYAQPLYVSQVAIPGNGTHNVVYAETLDDTVYAFDADTNAGPDASPLWQTSLLTNTAPAGTYTLNGGIHGTPVIDPTTNTMYLVSSETQSSTPIFRIHALDITSGQEKFGGPFLIQGSVSGTGSASSGGVLNFDASEALQRASLLLLNGVVYVAFAAANESEAWHGWILSYNAATLQPIGIYCTSPNADGAGIWMAGGGLAAEVNNPSKPYGRMFIVTGNGSYAASAPYDNTMSYGMSVVELDLTGGVMTVEDEFTPYNWAVNDAIDGDLGSGGPVLLPTQAMASGTMLSPLVQAGKTGTIYLLDRNNLGGFNAASDQIPQEVQTPVLPGVAHGWGESVYGSEAYWNNTVYFAGVNRGAPSPMGSYSYTQGQLSAAPTSQTGEQFTWPSPTPAVSSNGTTNGIVWVILPASQSGGPNILAAYDATNLANFLYSSDVNPSRDAPSGAAVPFTVPTIANGKAYVGAAGEIDVYGLLATASVAPAPAISISPVGGTPTATLTDALAGATIYYTTDGTMPSSNSPVYTTPLALPFSASVTITAIASANGYVQSAPASATYQPQIPAYSAGFNAAGLTLNGGSILNGTRLRLTDGGFNETRSAFYSTPLNIQGFNSNFSFQLTHPNDEGITFVIQGNSPTALGAAAGDLGFGGIGNSVAIKFDIYNNSGEGPDSTGLYTDGAHPKTPAIDLSSTGINLHSGDVFNVQLAYNGTTLTVVITDTVTSASATQTYAVNIPSLVGGATAYVGFTAATGGGSAIQEILNWSYTPVAPASVAPTPAISIASVSGTPTATVTDALAGVPLFRGGHFSPASKS